MELDGRASRRPLPRQLDSSDRSSDLDVRQPTGSSYVRQQSYLVGHELPLSRRLSTDFESRPQPSRHVLHPVNRYDSVRPPSDRANDITGGESAAWRTNQRGTSMQRGSSTDGTSVQARRDVPRGHHDGIRYEEASPTSNYQPSSQPPPQTYQLEEFGDHGLTSRMNRRHSPATHTDESSRFVTGDRAERSIRYNSPYRHEASSYLSSPSPSYAQFTSTPTSARSVVTTQGSSIPFSPSITDTPTTTTSSAFPTPPVTPEGETNRIRQEPTPDRSSPLRLEDRPAEYPHSPTLEGNPTASSHSTIETTPSESDARAGNRSSIATESSSLTPQQQREQLYNFRRDMRQVFARVDEMVDMHRDLFKCDPLSGLPKFDATQSRDVSTFTSDTFEQLNALREDFEKMTTLWSSAKMEEESLDSLRRASHRLELENQRRAPSSEDSDSTTSTPVDKAGRDIASSFSQFSSVGSGDRRPRWQPSLSSMSNQSKDSAASSSTDEENPVPSQPIDRPPPAPSSSRENVFDDFDRRMEEIRASLSALARDRPTRLGYSDTDSHESSNRSPLHRKHGSSSTSSTQDRSRENNGNAGNRLQTNNTNRQDREARLRRLLMELRETGDGSDAD